MGSGKPPVIQIHAEIMADVSRAPLDFFVIALENLGGRTVTPKLTSIAGHTHVRRNTFALLGSM